MAVDVPSAGLSSASATHGVFYKELPKVHKIKEKSSNVCICLPVKFSRQHSKPSPHFTYKIVVIDLYKQTIFNSEQKKGDVGGTDCEIQRAVIRRFHLKQPIL